MSMAQTQRVDAPRMVDAVPMQAAETAVAGCPAWNESFGPRTFRPFAPASREGRDLPFQILQNGANDQSSACETIFEVSPTSVLVLLGSCQSRLQREWA